MASMSRRLVVCRRHEHVLVVQDDLAFVAEDSAVMTILLIVMYHRNHGIT